MVEPKSDTSDMQRFDEMFIHLTPRGASVPYNVCRDQEGNIWVASKGGLFKFDGNKRTTMFESKNLFSKKMAAFSQVVCHKDKIIYTCGEDKDKTTEFRIFNYAGEVLHESFIDGLLISLAVSEEGEMFISKQPEGPQSIVYRCSIDTPLGWDPVVSSDDDAFHALCVIDENILVAAMCTRPVTMYSKQRLVFVDVNKGEVVKSFSSAGKGDGQIFFPRTIRLKEESIVILDKSGRFLKYSKDGEYVDVVAQIDAYLANGFCIKDNSALMALSGVVLDQDNRTICDDWLEWIELDGTSWKKQREEKKTNDASSP